MFTKKHDIAYGYKSSGGDVVHAGAEALGLVDVVVGQRTYALQGSLSNIRGFLKENRQKKFIGKSCDTTTGAWAQGPETLKIKIYDVGTSPTTIAQCAIEFLQKGALSAAGEVCDTVEIFNNALDALGVGETVSGKVGALVDKVTGKKITVEIDTYVKDESRGRGAYRVIDTNSTALSYDALEKILKARGNI